MQQIIMEKYVAVLCLGLVVLAIAVQGFVYGFSLINFAVTLTLLVISAPITHQKLIICLK